MSLGSRVPKGIFGLKSFLRPKVLLGLKGFNEPNGLLGLEVLTDVVVFLDPKMSLDPNVSLDLTGRCSSILAGGPQI